MAKVLSPFVNMVRSSSSPLFDLAAPCSNASAVRTALVPERASIVPIANVTEANQRAFSSYAHQIKTTPRTAETDPTSDMESSTEDITATVDCERLPPSPSKPPSSASSLENKAECHIVMTEDGTDREMFKRYIKTLPDQGSGDLWPFPELEWQTYVTYLTPKQAEEIQREPFIQSCFPNFPMTYC